MISSTRWQFAQAAEKAYQQKKADGAKKRFDGIIGIAERKSKYVVELLAGLGIEISRDMSAAEIGSGSHGIIWKFPCDHRTAVDPLADFYFREFGELQDNGTVIKAAKGEEIPLPDNHAEIVLSENVLDHTHSPEKILREVNRILKPGGIFYFSVDINSLPWYCMSKIYNFVFALGLHLHTRAFPAHPHHFRKNDVLNLFEKCGFQIKWQRVTGDKSKAITVKQKLVQLLGREQVLEIVATGG